MTDRSRVESEVARLLVEAASRPDTAAVVAPTTDGTPAGQVERDSGVTTPPQPQGDPPTQEAMWLAMGVPPRYYQKYKNRPGMLALYRDIQNAGPSCGSGGLATFFIGPIIFLSVLGFLFYKIAATGLFEKLGSIHGPPTISSPAP